MSDAPPFPSAHQPADYQGAQFGSAEEATETKDLHPQAWPVSSAGRSRSAGLRPRTFHPVPHKYVLQCTFKVVLILSQADN